MKYKKIKTLRTHIHHARFLSETNYEDNILETIPRIKDIPSPYAYSPEHIVYFHPHYGKIIIVETAHRKFDVFKLY